MARSLRFAALFNKFVRFSSSSSKPNPRSSSNFYNADSNCQESLVYKHKLQFQRPTTIEYKNHYRLRNTVSFIGSVVYPVKTMRRERGLGVYTSLVVKSSRDSMQKSFRVLVVMYRKMAEVSSKYLKENDLIYVSGTLGSFTKVDGNGHSEIVYKVIVDELNYVACKGKSQDNQKSEILGPKEEAISTSGAPNLEKKMDCLYLWQVFFASPHEWWDNRKSKISHRSPDFKHKDTGECLWLSPNDPPWVSRQLQRQDSRMAECGYRDRENSRSRVSMWKYDE